MHFHLSYLCTMFPDTKYIRFDKSGAPVEAVSHLAMHSLLPVVTDHTSVTEGATWWVLESDQTAQEFIEQMSTACERGVRTIVLSQVLVPFIDLLSKEQRAAREFLVVSEGRKMLIEVAQMWRSQCLLPVVGVAGSVGKTSTLNMLKSIGSVDDLPLFFSTEIRGSLEELARNILHVTGRHCAAVFELGVCSQGDMVLFADLLRPTMGVITSVGPAYLEGLGNLPDVLSEMRALFSYFSPSQIGIVCGDQSSLANTSFSHPVVKFGLKSKNIVHLEKVQQVRGDHGESYIEGVLHAYDHAAPIRLQSNHLGVMHAALAAAACAYFLYIPFDAIVAGLQRYVAEEGRFVFLPVKRANTLVIDDSKSLNPESVKAGMHALHNLDTHRKKMIVLADMPYLGERAAYWHRHVGRELIKARNIKDVVLIGQATRTIRPVVPSTMSVFCADDSARAQDYVQDRIANTQSIVLVNGTKKESMTDFARLLAQ